MVPENSSTGQDWVWTQFEPEMGEREKALRNRFVDEYLVDYSPLNACRRLGFQNAFAKEWAEKFMTESYVQKRIREIQHAPVDEHDLEEFNRTRIINQLMKEAFSPLNTGAMRVAALSKLMSHYGMDAPTKIQQDVNHRGGVMMVPGIASMDEWESVAMKAQDKLAQDARGDAN
jgi:hypothetical protein